MLATERSWNKRFEKKMKQKKKNETIALNILQVPHNEIKICHACKSEYNCKRKNQVVLLMINYGEKWHYIALKSETTDDVFIRPIKRLSKLFRGITANHNGDFHCLSCLHTFRTDNALKKHEILFENNEYCCIEMPTKFNEILNEPYMERKAIHEPCCYS